MRPTLLITFAIYVTYALGEEQKPCTITYENKYYDLSPLTKVSGQDYFISSDQENLSFYLNVCAELVQSDTRLKHPENVAAMQEDGYGRSSIGKVSTEPFVRGGEKLLLQYKDGDECPGASGRLKSTLISFICIDDNSRPSTPFFIVQSGDKCDTWLEWKTPYACPTTPISGSSSVWGLFLSLIMIMTTVYCAGGIMYNRIVKKYTGYRQIPHWEFWSSIFSWIKDMSIILFFTALERCKPTRSTRNYRGISTDEEHNLIDEELEE